ncbi:cytochrome-c peroxidase [Novispirillum itersonii]|uniref:Cytochrome c peroxidase n=1 Tax=Novispirillum itersonii TaxID=189 RepID=A0A7W9ZH02_NOVIT|nr:cytochrome c peroxidase [Novispirillum itersonii]MBB6211085.1 cytochrome c peroxidase [Novispirillum itersonii]
MRKRSLRRQRPPGVLWLIAGVAVALTFLIVELPGVASSPPPADWTEQDLLVVRSLSLSALPPLPADRSNRVADSAEAARLGQALFNDPRLSGDGSIACATCHRPERQFQDDRATARGIGETNRRTMPLAGVAYAPFLFWDGRADSLWAQALGPLENAAEHGGDRTSSARVIATWYRAPYERLFGPLPDLSRLPQRAGPMADPAAAAGWAAMSALERDAVTTVFVNIGKAIAAYERTLMPVETRFDRAVTRLLAGQDSGLTADERDGLRLFIGKAGCMDCHNGPLLTDRHFHNTGVAPGPGESGKGESGEQDRRAGARLVRSSPFNCVSPYSDAGAETCGELRFLALDQPDQVGAFKTPSLRGVADRPPYMRAGQIATLHDVLAHYLAAPPAAYGRSELRPLLLTAREVEQITAFLKTLGTD